MTSWKYFLQAGLYAVFAALIGFFSVAPAYQHIDPDVAVIKLAFSHAGERREPCRKLTPEELAQLAPNMRRPMACGRERLPLRVELEINDQLVYQADEAPTGIWSDGPSTVYQRFRVQAGTHRLVVRLRDGRDTVGFDYAQEQTVELLPGQNYVIGFRPETGGFRFQ